MSNAELSKQRIPQIFFAQLIFAATTFMVISRKSLRNSNANFLLFRESFRSLETLVTAPLKQMLKSKTYNLKHHQIFFPPKLNILSSNLDSTQIHCYKDKQAIEDR